MRGDLAGLDPLTASSRANEEARSGYSSSSAPINVAKMVDSALHVKRSDRSALKSDHIALPILVNIPRADIEQGTIQHRALYVVEVSGFGERSTVRYAFEKFEELYNVVSNKTRYTLPALPQSQWFGTTKEEVVQERRCKLQELLQKLLMLQEVLNDHEESIWKFLQLPRPVVVAARFLACPPTAKRLWLDRLWEASADKGGHKALQHPAVETELVQLARDAFDLEEGQPRPGSEEALSEASIACDLLARIFQRSDEADRDSSLKVPERHRWIEVLLMCVRLEEPRLETPAGSFGQEQGLTVRDILPLRETASKALRTLAMSSREAWTKILAAFLEEGGLAHLTSAAAAPVGSIGEGSSRQPFQRLVTELILRGFDKTVVKLFARDDSAKIRRSLLNTLFMSGDTFVRIMVGLFLCGFLCEDGFADEEKAQLGVKALLDDLQQNSSELSQADICLLLLESDIWSWLCSLVAVRRPLVNTYALLVVIFVCNPVAETILETEGFHQTLLSLCEPEADPTSRFFASKLLLTAHRQGDRESGIAVPLSYPELGHLCSCLAINFQAKYEYDLGQQDLLESEVDRACQWSEAASNLDELQMQACVDAVNLRSEASEWSAAVVMAGKSTELTQQSSGKVAESLAAFSISLDRASSAISDGTPSTEEVQLREELHAEEALLAEQERELSELEQSSHALAEERCVLSQTMAEKDEIAHKLESDINEATENAQEAASLGTPPGLVTLLHDYRQRHSETLQHLQVMRVRADELDAQLAEMCEPIPRWKAEIERGRCRVEDLVARSSALSHSSAVIETWAGLMDRQKACGNGHDTVRRSLRDVRGCVMSERERRRALRASVHQLLQSLTHLDSHLEALEAWDALDAEGGFLSFDANN